MSAGDFDFLAAGLRPFRISCWMVGKRFSYGFPIPGDNGRLGNKRRLYRTAATRKRVGLSL